MGHETNWFQDQSTDEAKLERSRLRDRVGFWFGIACLVVLLIAATYPTKAHSQELRAQSAEECGLLADYGLTTRALAISGIGIQKRLEILEQMYVFDERMKSLAVTVRKGADKSDKSAQDFSKALFQMCVMTRGDISGLLGAAL